MHQATHDNDARYMQCLRSYIVFQLLEWFIHMNIQGRLF